MKLKNPVRRKIDNKGRLYIGKLSSFGDIIMKYGLIGNYKCLFLISGIHSEDNKTNEVEIDFSLKLDNDNRVSLPDLAIEYAGIKKGSSVILVELGTDYVLFSEETFRLLLTDKLKKAQEPKNNSLH